MAIQIEVAEEGDCFASKSPQNPSGVPQNQNQNQNNEISNLQTNSSDSLKNINNDENNGSKKDFFTVYQRGIGKVNVICSTNNNKEIIRFMNLRYYYRFKGLNYQNGIFP